MWKIGPEGESLCLVDEGLPHKFFSYHGEVEKVSSTETLLTHRSEHSEMYARIVKGTFKCPDFFTRELIDILHGIIQTDTSKRYGCLKGHRH